MRREGVSEPLRGCPAAPAATKAATAFSLFGTKKLEEKNLEKRDPRTIPLLWRIRKFPNDPNPDNPPATNAQM
jgi:hypothetical protein